MRGFSILLGAVAVVRGANIPVVVDTSNGRLTGWAYTATQVGTGTEVLPAAWNTVTNAAQCGVAGKQSPIDIATADLVVSNTDPGTINTTAYDMDITGTLINDGRSVTYQITSPIRPYIEGGALTAMKTYVFNHMSFHFGSVSTQGSEHTIDAAKSPMELQLVHYDNSLLTEAGAKASTNADALAVVTFLFEVDTADNADLTPITSELANVLTEVTAGTKATGIVANLMKIIGTDMIDEYYYYDGSLTVPTCNENVKWIVSPNKIKISEAQLVLFRALLDVTSKNVYDNFRPVQSIGTRKVMHKKKLAVKKSAALGGAATTLGATLLGIGTFGAVYNLLNSDQTAKALKSNPILDFIDNFDEQFLSGDDQSAHHHHEHAHGFENQQFQDQQFQQPQQFEQRYR